MNVTLKKVIHFLFKEICFNQNIAIHFIFVNDQLLDVKNTFINKNHAPVGNCFIKFYMTI